jgi:hypothetical protein
LALNGSIKYKNEMVHRSTIEIINKLVWQRILIRWSTFKFCA